LKKEAEWNRLAYVLECALPAPRVPSLKQAALNL